MAPIKTKGKMVIIGNGFVGASAAFAVTMSGIASEMVLVDVNKEKSIGEAMDLNHGLSFVSQMSIYSGDYSDCKDADVIVITAGTARKPGETRLDLSKRNAGIVKSIVPNVMKYYNGGIIVVVSNPVDILTYMVQKESGLPAHKVIGSGTVLDSSRFRYLLSQQCGVDVRNVHGYVLGEHGDSEVLIWSATNVAGEKLDEFCVACTHKCGAIERESIEREVKQSGAKIIQYKGATYYAIALSINRICEAILKNQKSILTVGSVINGNYGINDVALSLPSVVGMNGIERIIDLRITDEEEKALRESAAKIREVIDQVL